MARRTPWQEIDPMLLTRRGPRPVYKHPVNAEVFNEPPIGARVADAVTGFIGSWKFIAIQTVIVVIWVVGNVILIFHFDPYPFILLNLAFSTQAAYAAPLILLASNRASRIDRMTLEHAADKTDVEEQQNDQLLNGTREILNHIDVLEHHILDLEKRIMERLDIAITGGEGGAGEGQGPDRPRWKPGTP
jgi:uncharacterized membrane protein